MYLDLAYTTIGIWVHRSQGFLIDCYGEVIIQKNPTSIQLLNNFNLHGITIEVVAFHLKFYICVTCMLVITKYFYNGLEVSMILVLNT